MAAEVSPGGTASGVATKLLIGALILALVAGVAWSVWTSHKLQAAYDAAVTRDAQAQARIEAYEARISTLTSSIAQLRRDGAAQRVRLDAAMERAAVGKIRPVQPKGLHADAIADRLNRIRL